MRLIIRADASPSVGTGHVMRSSAIAAEFLKLGHTVYYAGAIDPMSLILERFQEIGVPYPALDPVSFNSNPGDDILLIDSYSLSESDPFIAKEKWRAVVSISDEITPEYKVDLSIVPSLVVHPKHQPDTRILSGPEFLLLRNSISKNSALPSPLDRPIKIVVGGGGSDPSKFCNAVANELKIFPVNFVADIFSDSLEFNLGSDPRFRIHPISLNIDKFADECDLAITLASTLAVEMLAREIPLGVAAAFDNQELGFREMISAGFAAPVGHRDVNGNWEMNRMILEKLISSQSFRGHLQTRITGLIDLNGASRVASEILKLV